MSESTAVQAPAFKGFHQAWTPKLLPTAQQAVEEFAPKGVDPVYVKIVKDTARAMIAALPTGTNGVELKLECVGAVGRQILVQVTPHNL